MKAYVTPKVMRQSWYCSRVALLTREMWSISSWMYAVVMVISQANASHDATFTRDCGLGLCNHLIVIDKSHEKLGGGGASGSSD